MSIINICITITYLLFICNSCVQSSNNYSEEFDYPLVKQNADLRTSGNYLGLLKLNEEYLKIAEKEEYEDGKALCYVNLAYVATTLENYKQASFLFKKAESILNRSENKIVKTIFYDTYGDFNMILNLYETALNYNTKAQQNIKNAKDGKLKNDLFPLIYLHRADYLGSTNKNDSALIYLHKSRNLKKTAFIESLIAENHIQVKRMDSARIYIDLSLKNISNEKLRNSELFYIFFTAGNYFTEANCFTEAETAYNMALKYNGRIKPIYSFFTPYIYEALMNLYKKAEDKNKETFYTNKYYLAKKKSDDKQYKVLDLAIGKFISSLDKTKKRHTFNIIIAVVVSATIFGLLIYKQYKKVVLLNLEKSKLIIETENLRNTNNEKKYEEIINLAKENSPFFLDKFMELYPNFINNLMKINPNLETSELVFCAMIKLNFSSKEIANYTFVLHRSVQQRKYRLRKKLYISSNVDLYQFFNNL